jgi:Uma2 family endonuclease
MGGKDEPMLIESPRIKTKRLTGEEFARLGLPGWHELVKGRIVKMGPTGDEHGGYEGNFYFALHSYLEKKPIGKARVGEVGIYTHRQPDTVRGADALYISNERYAAKKSRSFLDVAPELVVEILSPDDSWLEVTEKLREYFAIEVNLVWVADPKARVVYAYRSLTDIREFQSGESLTADDILPGFSVSVSSLFKI